MLDLKIKLLRKTSKLPHKGHPNDACFDIYADILGPQEEQGLVNPSVLTIFPHETVMVSTGFATEIPHGYWGAIFARSGLASKEGLRPAQGVPVIDENYRGEWKIPLHNDSEVIKVIHHGDRIAQFMLLPWYETNLIISENLSDTDRGEGGFGSTGKQ